MAEVRIRLLGGFGVITDGRSVTEAFESGSARAFLARVAAEPNRPLARSMLAELLWPDRPAGAAAGNLRHCLSTVRRTIGDVDPDRPMLLATRTDIAIDVGAGVHVDLAEFDRLSSVAPSEPDAVASWESAVELRRGQFLAGFDTQLSEAWDTWMLTMRTAVDGAASTALRRLAEVRERTGEHRRALEHARRWIELDPWNEEAHRALLRLLALADRRNEALVHTERFAAALHSELGIQPSPETRALVADIREGRFPVVVPEIPTLPPRLLDGGAGEPCVGRSDELRWLRAHLDDSQAGSGRVVFVIGQPGSGKTVLIHEFERRTGDAMPNVLVVRGRCTAHRHSADPFLPFRQILGELLGDIEVDWANGLLTSSEAARLWQGLPHSVQTVLDHGPDLLGTLVDAEALCARFEQAFPDDPLLRRLRTASVDARQRSDDPTRRRQPLVEQCARVLTGISMVRPMLISIDDLQWADAGTLDVLASLSAKSDGVPMLVVAALRPGELEPSESTPVRRVVNEIASRGRGSRRLELVGGTDFVDAWLDREPNLFDADFRRRLFETTGGNALFTVELTRALEERGQIGRDERGRWFADRIETWDELPPRIEATIGARLAPLPVELRHDLDVASLAGPEFAAQIVAGARSVPAHDVILRLSGLCTTPSSLLRPAGAEIVGGGRVDRFRFRHVLFQQHLADQLAPAVRRELHGSIGRATEQVYASTPDRVASDLAVHFDAAGLADDALEYHGLAGRNGARLCAYDVAVRHFERAVELLESLEPSPELDKRRLVLLTSLGACHQAQHGYNAPQTAEVYDQIRELTRQVPPSLESAGAIGGLLTVDGLRANYLEALAEAEQLLAMAEELGSPPIESVARLQLGWMLLMVGRIVEADEQLTLAIDGYDPSWDSWLTPLVGLHVPSTVGAWRAITAWHLGHYGRARNEADRSIELARSARFPFGLAFALAVGGCVLGALVDEPGRISSHAEEMAAIAGEEDFAFYEAAAELHSGTAKTLSGDPVSGVRQMQRGLDRWSALGTEAFATWSRTWLAEALVRSGDLENARRELAVIDRMLADGEERLAELRRSYVVALLRRAEGDVEGAAEELRGLIAAASAARARGPEEQARAELGELIGAG